MEYGTKPKMLCLTIYSYKKEGLSDEEYRSYMLDTHAPLASTLMEKYGIVGFTMVFAPTLDKITVHPCQSFRHPSLTQLVLNRHT
jgi:EthD domain